MDFESFLGFAKYFEQTTKFILAYNYYGGNFVRSTDSKISNKYKL